MRNADPLSSPVMRILAIVSWSMSCHTIRRGQSFAHAYDSEVLTIVQAMSGYSNR